MRRFSNVIDDFHIFYHFGLKYSSVCYAIDEYIKRQVNVKKKPSWNGSDEYILLWEIY